MKSNKNKTIKDLFFGYLISICGLLLIIWANIDNPLTNSAGDIDPIFSIVKYVSLILIGVFFIILGFGAVTTD